MAELVLAPVAEKLIEKVIGKIIDACSEYLKDQVRWQRGMKKELENLLSILPQIQAVVSAHSQIEIKDEALNKWYWQLRDAIDEADDVLDEIEYKKLQKQAIKNNKSGKLKSIKKRIVKISKRAFKIDSYLKRLEEAVQKLNKVSAKVSAFESLVIRAEQKQQQQQLKLLETRETGALIKDVLLGRSKEMEFLSQWLRNSNQTQSSDTTDLFGNISLLSVVGHGGMGKTTLLQHAYDKNAALFDVKMWVCVSTNFDPKTVIKNILEFLLNQKPDSESLAILEESLHSKVKHKKFLLVLDDIWEDDEEKWKNVFAVLRGGYPGSKILISTRILSVASMFANMIKNNQIYHLEGLEKEGCLQLFNKHAFAGRNNPGGIFRDIAEKIVEKLSRCPLGVKFIANFLNTCMEETFWTNVLNTNIANIKLGENGLLDILKLSYNYLPDYLQNCFAFCCIFPQDHKFDKDDLIRMWIAVGFIQSPDISGDTLENTGKRYFNILVQKSFFNEFYAYDYRVYYKMHDLLHDLAQSVSIQECSRVVDDKLSISDTIRHLSIHSPSLEVLKEMEKFKHLRSLILFLSEVAKSDENVISQILKASKSLRLLVIYPPDHYYNVPETIDRLIHLRYLKVDLGVLKLSRCISHLYHLQFVIFDFLENLVMDNFGWEELRPNENCHLIMDELVINDTSKLLMEPVRSISYLRFLMFHNDNLVSFPSEPELWFLQHSSTLLQLKYEYLKSLQSLPSLLTFSSLTYLRLWKIPLLKSLPDLPSSLKMLYLYELESLESLESSLSAISNSLETIELREIPLLKSLPDLPSSLKKLELYRLESLESLPSSLSAISSLETLKLSHIPLLKSFPDLPCSLKMLWLFVFKSLDSLPSSLSAIPSLETLQLSNIPLLKSLPDFSSSLKKLELSYLYSLQFLPSSLSAIPSLETLKLYGNPLLKSLPDLPSSLKMLELIEQNSLQCLPSSLSVIPSLNTLVLLEIPLLKSLTYLPSSLESLKLITLENLDCMPSCLPARLRKLYICRVPRLLELPDLPSSLEVLYIEKCDPQLMERYRNFRRQRQREANE